MTNTNPYDAWADRTMSDIDVPDGLINASSGNDVCPSVMTKPKGNGNFYVQLFIDYPDPADREDSDSDRYTVYVMGDGGDEIGEYSYYATDVYGCALTASPTYALPTTTATVHMAVCWTPLRTSTAHCPTTAA